MQDTLTHTQKVKKSSLTFAPEAGTQRLRDVINKNVTEADLVSTLTNAFSNGWNAVKLYFMTGLPTETDEDLIGIAELAKTAAGAYYSVPKEKRVKGLRITCSAAVFVPKPFTPFQWCRQDDPETVRRKQRLVREHFAPLKSAHFNYHDSGVSQIEACFALGDRRLARVLHRAWQLGCRLDGWTDQFRYDCGFRRLRTAGWTSPSTPTASARWTSCSPGTTSTRASTRRFSNASMSVPCAPRPPATAARAVTAAACKSSRGCAAHANDGRF